jgi:serpin B
MNSTIQATSEAEQQQLAFANMRLAFNLLNELVKEQPGANIFMSPFSVSAALQLVCSGARGQTKREMEEVLGTGGLTTETANEVIEPSANR